LVQSKFQALNTLCFEGRLPAVSIRMSSARSFMGKLSWRQQRRLFGRPVNTDFVLRISTRYPQTEQQLEDTLLHEMIHYDIALHQLRDTGPHGPLFRQKMDDINRRFGRHITISHRRTEEEHRQDTEHRQHLVCVSRMRDGRVGITIAAKTRLFWLWDRMPLIPEISSLQWYSTTDAFFNRYPRSRTLRIYPVSLAELEPHLKGARPLYREGRKIYAK